MNAFFFGERTGVAMQGHVAVGNVVAENEEPHGDMVARGGDGAPPFFVMEHLEVVDDAVGQGFAAVGAVAAFDIVGLVEQWRIFRHQPIDGVRHGQLAERCVWPIFGGAKFYDMAGTHVFEDFVGVPGSLNDKIAVFFEPLDQRLGF